MRSAQRWLKTSGMCCAMTTPGASGGSAARICATASVPPVDDPIAIRRSVVPEVGDACATRGPRQRAPTTSAVRAAGRAVDAALTLSTSTAASSSSPSWMSILGLGMKSIAPSCSAASVASAPRSVSDDTITTGIGRSRIRLRRKVRPSIFGISMSSVSTSGLSA